MYRFDYYRPSDLDEAAALVGQLEDAKLLAGGMTLLPTMKQRLAGPTALIDLNAIQGLDTIELVGSELVIGAMARHFQVASSALVRNAIPALAELAGKIGDPAVRHRGTIGGSISNNDPAADYPAAALGLGAVVVTNRRRIPAADFFVSLFETALEEGEIVVELRFPICERAAWRKFRSPASRYAVVGVFLACGGGEVRVAVTGSGAQGVFRERQFESALGADFRPEAIADLRTPEQALCSDIHADRPYRANLINVLTRQAVSALQRP